MQSPNFSNLSTRDEKKLRALELGAPDVGTGSAARQKFCGIHESGFTFVRTVQTLSLHAPQGTLLRSDVTSRPDASTAVRVVPVTRGVVLPLSRAADDPPARGVASLAGGGGRGGESSSPNGSWEAA